MKKTLQGLSLAAALVLVGGLAGCGGGGSGTSQSNANVVKNYAAYLAEPAYLDGHPDVKSKTGFTGEKGKITFVGHNIKSEYPNDIVIVKKGTGCLDDDTNPNNNNNIPILDPSGNFIGCTNGMPIGMTLKGYTQNPIVTAISTLAIDTADAKLKELVMRSDADPVEAANRIGEDPVATKLALLNIIAKTIYETAATPKDVNTAALHTFIDSNITKSKDIDGSQLATITSNPDVKKSIEATISTFKAIATVIEKVKDQNKTIDAADLYVKTIDAPHKDANASHFESIINEVLENADVNVSDINVSEIAESIESNLTVVKDVVKNRPVSLTLLNDIITIGDEEVVIRPNGTFYVAKTVDDSTKIEDFFHIKAPVNTYAIDKNATVDAALTIEISDRSTSGNEDKNVTLKINNAKIKTEYNENNLSANSVEVIFDANRTTVTVSQNNIARLTAIGSGDSATGTVTKDLVLKDFDFSVSTLLNNLSSSQNKIKNAIDQLDTFVKESREYDVSICVDANITTDYTDDCIKGKVVLERDAAANKKAVEDFLATLPSAISYNDIKDESYYFESFAQSAEQKGIDFTIESSNPNVLYVGEGGFIEVIPAYEETQVTLTVKLQKGTATGSKSYTITVPAKPIELAIEAVNDPNSVPETGAQMTDINATATTNSLTVTIGSFVVGTDFTAVKINKVQVEKIQKGSEPSYSFSNDDNIEIDGMSFTLKNFDPQYDYYFKIRFEDKDGETHTAKIYPHISTID